MAEERLTVVYDGAAVETGRMAVRDLAPSLLALADAFQEAQTTLYPDDPAVSVEIVANREGSFEVDLQVVHRLVDQAVRLLSGDPATAAVHLLDLGGRVIALLWLIKTLAGRQIAKREEREGRVTLTLEDGTTLQTKPEVMHVYDRVTIRRLMRDFVNPLRRDGIESIKVEHRDESETVNREDRPAFDLDPDDEVVNDTTTELIMQVAALQWGNKWKLTDPQGNNPIWVTIDDPEFSDQIARDQARFAMHDLLRVQLRTIQKRDTEGVISTEHRAERIVHLPVEGMDQPRLDT